MEYEQKKLGLNKLGTDEDTFFENYGTIIDCTIMRDADEQSRGFGIDGHKLLYEGGGLPSKTKLQTVFCCEDEITFLGMC